jgi:hypothetical protein
MATQPLDAAFAARQDNRKKSSRRFIILGALFVGLAGTAASVYAANININSTQDIFFAQGVEDVASCSENATTDIASSYTAANGFEVASVTVSDLAAACDGMTMDVYLTDGSTLLGQVTGITIDGTSVTVNEFMNADETSSVSIPADDVTDVAVEIRG